MKYRTIETSVGPIMIAGDDHGIRYLSLLDGPRAEFPHNDWEEDPNGFEHEVLQLREYFDGHRQDFELTLCPVGTEFQRDVWRELPNIPYGQTLSYGELAARIGRPRASRAVGAANGANPIGIVIPCHRVIGADGSLTGYGGGIENKRALLALEGAEI